MRVLLIPELYPTDENPVAGIFINDQIKAIQKFADVVVFNTSPFYRGMYLQQDGVEYFDFHLYAKKPAKLLKPFLYRYWENKALSLALKIPKIDLIHAHGSALRGRMAMKLARNKKIPLIITEHTGPWSAISSRYSVFEMAKKVLNSANVVMPVSHHLKTEMLHSGVEMKRVEVLGNPIDDDQYSLRQKKLDASKQILFVGRLDEFKGGLRTLKAFHSIVDNYPQWTLTIAGKGEESDVVKEYIAQNNLNERLSFMNNVFTRNELKDLYHSSSFLVFPSRFESFGLVAAEAMSTGLPVVCTNQTGPLDYALPENALQVNPDSIDDIAIGMKTMIEKLDQMQPEKIRNSILKKYGIHSYSEKLNAVYQSLLS